MRNGCLDQDCVIEDNDDTDNDYDYKLLYFTTKSQLTNFIPRKLRRIFGLL